MRSFIVFVLLSLFSFGCVAEDIRYVCPPHIAVSEAIKSRPSEWQVFNQDIDNNAKHYLEYVSFSDGHPQDLAYLRPSSEIKHKSNNEALTTSVFEMTGVSPDGMYLICGYAQTTVTLIKSVGSAYKVCKVASSDVTHVIKSIKCN